MESYTLPELVVFDLDMCLWSPEMYSLSKIPTEPVKQRMKNGEQLVVGVKSGRQVVSLFPGALEVLQRIHSGEYGEMRIAAASSADTPFATQCAHASLKVLEVAPGVTVYDVFHRGWDHEDDRHLQIGRSPPLSHDKKTHFTLLHKGLGVPFESMLFFDDCNWGDNCARVRDAFGVVTQKTPNGLQVEEWEEALLKYHTIRTDG